MFKYVIVLAIAVTAVGTYPAPSVQAATAKMSSGQIMEACRTELGRYRTDAAMKACYARKKAGN